MDKVSLKWITPDADRMVNYLARVSNPSADPDTPSRTLIAFLIKHRHWSPFEMASACIEINTTRDIGRQILRHRSFSFQEFSQRYAEVRPQDFPNREMRRKGSTNRQGSLNERIEDAEIIATRIAVAAYRDYSELIGMGIAPECARAVLPEGFTPTRMYMAGTIRSWIHYIRERTGPTVQKEHREIAMAISNLLGNHIPEIWAAVHEHYETENN